MKRSTPAEGDKLAEKWASQENYNCIEDEMGVKAKLYWDSPNFIAFLKRVLEPQGYQVTIDDNLMLRIQLISEK